MATFEELTTPTTDAEELNAALTELTARGFPVTSWREGDVARTIVQNDARALSEYSTLRQAIAAGTLLRAALSLGLTEWITLRAKEGFNLDRNLAVATKGTVRLTAAAEAGPYTITPGQLRFASSSGLRFQSSNTANVTLAKGGTLDLEVQAESPGAAYNVANGTITTMLTPLAGVTCSNPNPGSGTWITTSGVDQESNASLVARCEARWPESGFGSPGASYELWARTADATITRTKVSASGTVAGRIDVYVAGAAGPVGAGAVAAAQAYITPRAPLGIAPVVSNVTATVLSITATLYGKAQYETAALAAATAAIQALVAGTAIAGTIYGAAKIEALMLPEGVENAVISVGGGDTVLTAGHVATLTLSLSWVNT
jgi:uncharacterized phage protein gp47/JayE